MSSSRCLTESASDGYEISVTWHTHSNVTFSYWIIEHNCNPGSPLSPPTTTSPHHVQISLPLVCLASVDAHNPARDFSDMLHSPLCFQIYKALRYYPFQAVDKSDALQLTISIFFVWASFLMIIYYIYVIFI